MKAKVVLAALIPFLFLAIESHTIAMSRFILFAVFLLGVEISSVVVFFLGKILQSSEEDSVRVETAEVVAIFLTGIMLIVLLGTFLACLIADKSLLCSQLFSNKNFAFVLLLLISLSMAGSSGIIAFMPLRGKWANIRHTTVLLLGSVLFFTTYLAAYTNLWVAGIIFAVLDGAIFIYSFRRTSDQEKKESLKRNNQKSWKTD